MAKRPEFKPVRSDDGWMINIPKSMTVGGKDRQRRFFEDRKEAEKFAKKKRAEYHSGQRGTLLPMEELQDAVEALKILKPLNISLLECAKSISGQIEKAGKSETFRERFNRASSDNESRWRARYALDMTRLPRWVGEEFMAMKCSLITASETESALRANGTSAQSTLESRLRYVSAILNHKPRYRKVSAIEMMTLAQCAKMIRAAENPPERWAVAILLFAGIRPSAEDGEITRLDWSAFGEKEIYVPEDVSKTGSDRHIPISPRLRRLIKGHPTEGAVIPANWRRVYRRLRQAAGLTTEQDITRHTFASHFLAAYGEKATKDAMGHTKNSDTLFRHYRRAVLERDGKAYFDDLPRAEKIAAAKEKSCKAG